MPFGSAMKKSNFLKYVSIVLMLVSLVRFFFGVSMFNFYATARTFGSADKELLRLAGINLGLLAACAVAELVCGFQGALNWEEPLNAPKCIRWGVAALALGLAGNLMQAYIGYGVSYVAWITGVAAPLLYLAAAVAFAKKSK